MQKKVFPRNLQHSLVYVSAELCIGILFSFASLLFIVKLAHSVVWTPWIQNLDMQVVNSVVAQRTPQLTQLMLVVTELGARFSMVCALLVCIALSLKHYKREASFLALVLIAGLGMNLLLKNFAERPRPPVVRLALEQTFSFPSGHAMNSFLFYGMLTYLTFHFTRNRRLTLSVGLAAGLIILAIGYSRVYLGVHYLTDVLAGYVAGFWWLVTLLVMQKSLLIFRLEQWASRRK